MVSRESGFLINNWIFMAILGVVFCGTLFPKITEWLGKEILVGPAYFNARRTPRWPSCCWCSPAWAP